VDSVRDSIHARLLRAATHALGLTQSLEDGSTTCVYDRLNRLQTLTPPSAFTSGNFGFSYDALSRRTQMTRPNSVTTNYAYDNLSRLAGGDDVTGEIDLGAGPFGL
jgi:YD repeat-containing protein